MLINAAIPLVASLLGGLFQSITTFFAQYLTKRLAMVAAAIVAIGALTTAFFVSILALMANLDVVFPPYVIQALGHILPSEFPYIVSIVLTAQLTRWVYVWNTKIVQLRLF